MAANINRCIQLTGHQNSVVSNEFSPHNPNLLATSSSDSTIKLWDIVSAQCLKTFTHHCYAVNCVKWSNDGRFVAACSSDTFVSITDVEKGSIIRVFEGHCDFVNSVSFNSNNNLLASGGYDNTLILWDTRNSKSIYKIVAHSDPLTSVCFCDDDTVILTGSYDGFFRFWDVTKGINLQSNILEADSPITYAKMLTNSEYALISGFKNAVSLFSIQEGEEIVNYEGATIGKYPIQCSFGWINGNALVASGSESNELLVWGLNNGNAMLKHKFKDGGFVCGVDFSKVSNCIACCGPNEKHMSYVIELNVEKQ